MVRKSRRLTRRDMKQKDQVMSGFESAVAWASDHPRLLGNVVIGIVALFAAGLAGYYWWHQRVDAANRDLGEVTRMLDPSAGSVGSGFETGAERIQSVREGANRVAEQYGLTGAGRVARLVEASSMARQGEVDEALVLLEDLASDRPSDMVAGAAALARAELLAADGSSDEAEQALRRLASRPSGYIPQDMVLRRLAELLESRDDVAGAVETYQRLLDEAPDSPLAPLARSKLEELELASTSEVPEVEEPPATE